jgi:hypothetical protein
VKDMTKGQIALSIFNKLCELNDKLPVEDIQTKRLFVKLRAEFI